MTVGELREYLEEYDEEVEVRLAHQPRWPLEYGLDQVILVPGDKEHPISVVYLAEGEQLGYLSGQACKALGWDE